MGGGLREAVGADDGCSGDHGVVAEMEEEAGDDGTGVGAGEGEYDADEDEETYDAPGPTELRAVHQAKEDSGEQDSGKDAEGFGEKRIKIAAEDGFLDERSDENGHGH